MEMCMPPQHTNTHTQTNKYCMHFGPLVWTLPFLYNSTSFTPSKPFWSLPSFCPVIQNVVNVRLTEERGFFLSTLTPQGSLCDVLIMSSLSSKNLPIRLIFYEALLCVWVHRKQWPLTSGFICHSSQWSVFARQDGRGNCWLPKSHSSSQTPVRWETIGRWHPSVLKPDVGSADSSHNEKLTSYWHLRLTLVSIWWRHIHVCAENWCVPSSRHLVYEVEPLQFLSVI